jgi:hypothetical protein
MIYTLIKNYITRWIVIYFISLTRYVVYAQKAQFCYPVYLIEFRGVIATAELYRSELWPSAQLLRLVISKELQEAEEARLRIFITAETIMNLN